MEMSEGLEMQVNAVMCGIMWWNVVECGGM